MRLSVEDVLSFEKRYRATFFNSLSGYRSVHLCSTVDRSGVANLSVVNSVFHIGSSPPYLGMMLRPKGARQHTLTNIKETGWYTLNQMATRHVKEAHQASARYLAEQDEFEEIGLSKQFDGNSPAPFVAESPIKYSLRLEEILTVQSNGTFLIIGHVQHIELNQEWVADDGYVDLVAADSLAVNGLDAYHKAQKIDRFNYAKSDQAVSAIS